MAVTATTIANLALGKLGASTISDINDTGSRESRACNRNYAQSRDIAIRSHRWACAIHRQSLAASADEIVGDDYAYQYQLPVDPYCLRALDIIGFPNADFRIEGRMLLTNELPPIYLRYIKRILDPNSMDSGLIELIAVVLAHEICYELTKSLFLKREMKADYAVIVSEAVAMNQIEAYGTDTCTESIVDVGRD